LPVPVSQTRNHRKLAKWANTIPFSQPSSWWTCRTVV